MILSSLTLAILLEGDFRGVDVSKAFSKPGSIPFLIFSGDLRGLVGDILLEAGCNRACRIGVSSTGFCAPLLHPDMAEGRARGVEGKSRPSFLARTDAGGLRMVDSSSCCCV